MKLHLPLRLRAAVLACAALVAGVASPADAAMTMGTDLGGTMFIGDSITHGATTTNISWRWWMHRLFADNGISYDEMGIMRGNSDGSALNSARNVDVKYGDTVFRNVHASQSGANSADVVGTRKIGKFENTNIRQWLGIDANTSSNVTPVDGTRINTYFVMLGTNDTLTHGDYGKISWTTDTVNALAEEIKGNFEGILAAIRNPEKGNPNAKVIFAEIPVWYNWNDEANIVSHINGVTEINRQLRDWAEAQGDLVTMVNVNAGLVDVAGDVKGRGLKCMYAETNANGLHPNDQGSLLIAGNLAKGLGYAGATAGQQRRAASDFEIKVLGREDDPRLISQGESLSGSWVDTPTGGFTVAFAVRDGIGNGEESGWNKTDALSISVSNGAKSGTLSINEAYIQWGNVILYSLDTSVDLTEALRVAYVVGNGRLGLSSGFYVWMGDQLIGEALSSSGSGEAGVTLTNSTEGDVKLSELYMATGSWAPDSNGIQGTPAYITPMVVDTSNPYINNPGVSDWPLIDGQQEVTLTNSNRTNAGAAFAGTEGGVLTGDASGGIFIIGASNDTKSKLYVTLQDTSAASGFSGVVGGSNTLTTYNGNVYMRILGDGSSHTYNGWFGVVNAASSDKVPVPGGVDGDLYMEFSDPGLKVTGGKFATNYNTSVAGTYRSANVTGTLTMVFNTGSYQYLILGGSLRDGGSIGKVDMYINGGTFNGNVFAGGVVGTVGTGALTISGDDAVFGSGVGFISSGAASGGSISGDTTLTIADMTSRSSLASYAGKLTGGADNTGGTKRLIFRNAQLGELNAQLEQFDRITIEKGSELSLSAFGGATDVSVDGTSALTIRQSTETQQLTKSIALYVGSQLTLESGVALTLSSTGDANLNGGNVLLEDGSALTLTANVEGEYTVEMDSGSSLDATLLGTSGLTVSCNVLLNDTTGNSSYTIDGVDKVSLTLVSLTAGSSVQLSPASGAITLAGANCVVLKRGELADADNALLQTQGALSFADSKSDSLTIDVNDIIAEVEAAGRKGKSYFLTQGDISGVTGGIVYDAALAVLHWTVNYETTGAITFVATGMTGNIYISDVDNDGQSWGADNQLDIYDQAALFDAIYINRETHLTLPAPENDKWKEDGLVLKNLMGATGSDLYIDGVDDDVKVTISNSLGALEREELEDELGCSIRNSLTFEGHISITHADLQIRHVDPDDLDNWVDSTTILRGGLSLEGGNLEMTSGVLQLEGAESDLGEGDVIFAGNDAQLVVSGTRATLGGRIELNGTGQGIADRTEHILLQQGGELVLRDGAAVGAGITIGNEAAVGEVAGVLTAEGSVAAAAAARLQNIVLHVADQAHLTIVDEALLNLQAASAGDPWALAGLEGSGALSSDVAQDIHITPTGTDHCYSGDLSGYTGTMFIDAGTHTQRFEGVLGGSGWNLDNTSGGRVVLDLMGSSATNSLTMGDLTLHAGSHTSILLDLTAAGGLSLSNLSIEDDAVVTLGQYSGTVTLDAVDGVIRQKVGEVDQLADIAGGVIWNVSGVRNASQLHLELGEDGTSLYLTGVETGGNQYGAFATNVNAATGAKLVWDVANSYRYGGDIAAIDRTLWELLGENTALSKQRVAEANRLMAAVAGSSIPTLNRAFAADMERQLRTMRTRVSALAAGAAEGSAATPWTFWLNAETDYHREDEQGMMPGFRSNAWGGTVGAARQVDQDVVLGLALSAMYSDVNSMGPDHLKADMTTSYLSAFARVSSGKWQHSLIGSVGLLQADIDRSVSYQNVAYSTSADTSGVGVGLAYETSYSVGLNEDGSVLLQPLAHVTWHYSHLNGYAEHGSNAALAVSSQSYHTGSLGVGARLLSLCSGDAINHEASVHMRALLKAHVGDRVAKARVGFSELGSATGRVRAAEHSVLGAELGAGVNVPLNAGSELFLDFSAEVSNRYADLNATVGYKTSF